MRPRGDDLTISTGTTVKLELQGIDTKTYHLMTTQRYQFRNSVPVDRFVIFATCNALLRDTISAACRYPLFELYFIPDSSLFLDSVDDLRHSTQIAIDYLDHDGQRRSAEPEPDPAGRGEVRPVGELPDVLPRGHGPAAQAQPDDHMSDLRIFECDLSGIADDHVVRAIRGLTVWSRTLAAHQRRLLLLAVALSVLCGHDQLRRHRASQSTSPPCTSSGSCRSRSGRRRHRRSGWRPASSTTSTCGRGCCRGTGWRCCGGKR